MNQFKPGIFLLFLITCFSCFSDSEDQNDQPQGENPKVEITTLPFQTIELNDLSMFLTDGDNWEIVSAVKMDYLQEQDASSEKGTGVLFNKVPDNSGAHIFTNWEHGDLEIEYEVMVPKGSNSGVYFMSRYEIQVFDSWGIDNPQHSDLGGIYQRWNDSAPEGQQGYEGHAPAINAAKAPGLWQKFYVKFTAPRFDEAGNKISNARFDKVELNGMLIHENVELSGPTRAAPKNDEVATAPLMIQGDHGKVAFRNIRYKRFFDQTVKLTAPMTYKYYEIGEGTALPDFSTLSPVEEGSIDSFLIDKIAKREDYIAIQFIGEIEIPQDGDYIFHTISDDGTKLYINDNLIVDNDFNHGPERKSGLINLSKGKHQIQLDYYNNTWGRSLRVLYEGPQMVYQTLASPALQKSTQKQEPLLLDPKSEPELLRGFVYFEGEKRTHAISVGDPLGVHYSLDLNNGALLKAWRGGFADVTNMWQGRGHDQTALPQSMAVELSDGQIIAQLSNAKANYPNTSDEFKLEAYDLDDAGRPTFRYTLGDAGVSDRMHPGELKNTLVRTLEIQPNGTTQLYSRIASADYIETLDNGLYSIGGKYYLKILSEGKPQIQQGEDKADMIFPIKENRSIKYEILW